MLSLANMAGRIVWSSLSDRIGRKPIYMLYLGGGLALYGLLALVGSQSVAIFVVLAMGILSFYGGGFATVPAYLKDLFGTLEVGAIHGRLLTAWAAAGVVGPADRQRLPRRCRGARFSWWPPTTTRPCSPWWACSRSASCPT